MSEIIIVGIGEDGTAGLSAEARAAVQAAELLCGGKRHLAFFPESASGGAERLAIKGPLEPLIERLGQAMVQRRVVVLASGDPCCFGIAPLLAERLGRSAVRVLPNVGAVQLAFARLAEPWQDAAILSAHGRPLEGVIAPALAAQRAAILTDATNTPAAIARALRQAGMEDCRTVVGERLGGPEERLTETTLYALDGQMFDPLNVLLLLRETNPRARTWRIGLPDEAYAHRDGQITKAEVRAVSLSKLRLSETDIVWDVGAGCGSLSLEAADLARCGAVYAIERDPAQWALLEQNLALYPAPALHPVHGEAPEALVTLPDPDAIFLGGSGGRLPALLDSAVDRLRAGGRLVANLVALSHLSEYERHLAEAGWATEIVQVSISRAVPIAGSRRLAAQNPVFVLSAVRPP